MGCCIGDTGRLVVAVGLPVEDFAACGVVFLDFGLISSVLGAIGATFDQFCCSLAETSDPLGI